MSTKPPKALSRSAVADAIRHGIMGGDLVPGQRLVEAELCESLSASRGTVRSALMDLAHEGLVEHIANRGARVRIVSLKEALQIGEVRFAVESLCVVRAAKRITDAQIKSLRDLAKQLKDRAKRGDVVGFADLMHQTFEKYIQIADQPVAAEVLSRLRARNAHHQYRLTYRPGRAQVSLPFRLEVIEAICNRDPNAARIALQRHADNIRESMTALASERKPFMPNSRGEVPQQES
jgi:DNA-binding GntR family transcriptional regulator